MKKSLLILPLVLLASALALAACGGGSSSSGGGEEAAVEEAIETSATSTDPSKCTEAQTAEFNERETGETGAAALETCEEEAEEKNDAAAETVTVSQVEIEGEEAAAQVEIEGGSLNGQTVAVGLQKEEGNWKLDAFIGFMKYSPEDLAASLEERLGEEENVSPELAACVAEGVEGMEEEEVEAMVFEKETEGFEEVVSACSE